jgi:hypothetical protein
VIYWVNDNGRYRVWRKEWQDPTWIEHITDQAAFNRLAAVAEEFPNLIGPFEEHKEA